MCFYFKNKTKYFKFALHLSLAQPPLKKDLKSTTTPPIFEQIKRLDEYGVEYWSARDLSKVFEYLEYRNFQPAIERAKEACQNSGQNVADHFVDIHEMITIGKGGERTVESVKLSRYACYLIVQNADPAKEVVALGQTYFAVQTRLQEICEMEAYNNLVSDDEKRRRQESTSNHSGTRWRHA